MSRGPWNKCEIKSKFINLYAISSYAHETVSRKMRMACPAHILKISIANFAIDI
ncbi:MAG: hypothetical protein K9L17_14185 [Clostridiales bacterium]|nr:hypothetical protein [Clostridiales bacterium]MCF8023818.1 hypothetical protein [Clostridiales bacterium]